MVLQRCYVSLHQTIMVLQKQISLFHFYCQVEVAHTSSPFTGGKYMEIIAVQHYSNSTAKSIQSGLLPVQKQESGGVILSWLEVR